MKILITTIFDYPHPGGLSTHVATLKAGLEQRGHVVDILSFTDIPALKQKAYAKGPSFLLNKVAKGRGIIWSQNARKKLVQSLVIEAKKNEYDIINAQDVFATLASIESGIPTVSTVHGYMTFEAISRGSVDEGSKEADYLQQKEIEAYQNTLKVITVDERIKDYVKKQAGVDGNKIRNFIDIDTFKPDQDKKQTYREKHGIAEDAEVLFVPRRLTKKNGVIYPALAMPAILKERPNAQLIYAGSGEALDDIKRIVAEHKLENQVTLLGPIAHDTIKEYYALSDVVLVPSVYSAGVEEATSISALEAMGSGSPLVACAVGGLKEIVNHEEDGLLVEEKSVEQLADAVIRLLKDPAYGQALADRARTKIENEYSHITAAEKYEAIYIRALEDLRK